MVFYYDTGNSKSYKGEPTTNLVTNPTFLGTSGTQTSTISKNWNFSGYTGATGFNFYNSSTSPIPLKFPNEGAVITTEANGSNNRRIYYNGTVEPNTTYTLSYWVYSSAANSISNYFFIYQADNSDAGSTSFGYPITVGEWVYVEQSFTTTATTTNTRAVNWGPVISRDANTLIAMQRFQIEAKPHATQFVDGTRSATEGLLDFTKNATIDLTNVSFDSDAQMTFDGTNDYIQSSEYIIPATGPFTVEFLYRRSTAGGRGGLFERRNGPPYNGMALGQGASNNWTFTVTSHSDTAKLQASFTYPSANEWYHDVGVFNGTNTVQAFRNGELVDTDTGVTVGNLDTEGTRDKLLIMARTTSETTVGGDVAIVKVYDRALTAEEVQQNYNTIKGRFGI